MEEEETQSEIWRIGKEAGQRREKSSRKKLKEI